MKSYVQRLETHRKQIAAKKKKAERKKDRKDAVADSHTIGTRAGWDAVANSITNPSKSLN
jgi:hypothetical protein